MSFKSTLTEWPWLARIYWLSSESEKRFLSLSMTTCLISVGVSVICGLAFSIRSSTDAHPWSSSVRLMALGLCRSTKLKNLLTLVKS